MALIKLSYKDIGFPDHMKGLHCLESDREVTLFDLSSHAQAKKALEFGLKLHDEGFHIFVIGEERSGRLDATMGKLLEYSSKIPVPKDWVYVNNFIAPQRPYALALAPGIGRKLKGHLSAMLHGLQVSLQREFQEENTNTFLQKITRSLEDDFGDKIEILRKKALRKDFDIIRDSEGRFFITPLHESKPETPEPKKNGKKKEGIDAVRDLQDELETIGQQAHAAGEDMLGTFHKRRDALAAKVIEAFTGDLLKKFKLISGFAEWVDSLAKDLFLHYEVFLGEEGHKSGGLPEALLQRYSVNILVDHSAHQHAPIVTLAHPSYENLFGSIKYRAGSDGFETDFNLIQGGALHKANGGILVIHADALAQQREVWDFLKRALRDREIRIEEIHRQHGMPMLLAPAPKSIPLNVQVVLIGAPWWFDDFFSSDPEFRSYFKVRSEIDLTMPTTPENKSVYVQLIRQWAANNLDKECDDDAIRLLLGHSARWAGHRKRLSARFELIGDMLIEANIHAEARRSQVISEQDLNQVFIERRERKSAQFSHHVDEIMEGRILLQTSGETVGQANALTVLTNVDYTYGIPARVTARTYAAKEGVVSIERSIEMSGAIQDKGIMILSGYLNGLLGQHRLLSFGCSITFEQLYVPIDGDSASLAELLAVLSSLSELPLAQSIAVTGAVDQHGNIQAVGGIHQKIEGFFEVCCAGGLTGHQGVIIPEANKVDLVMWSDLEKAVKKGAFHIWTAAHVDDVTPLMLGAPLKLAKSKAVKKSRIDKTIEERILRKITAFNKLLKHE